MALLIIAMIALAVRPEVLIGGPPIAFSWGVQQTLVVLALGFLAVRHGVRRRPNWPAAAMVLIFVLALVLGDLHPQLTSAIMLASLVMFLLPWMFTQVVMPPGSRRALGLAIGLAPLISVVAGILLGIDAALLDLDLDRWASSIRVEGAMDDPGLLALIAFSGFAACLHEATRPGRPHAVPLALLNLVILLLTGSRMGILASAVLVAIYVARSPELKARWRASPRLRALSVVVLLVAAGLAAPTIVNRVAVGPEGGFDMSARDEIWSFYYEEFLLSPVFGRGLGASTLASVDWLPFPRKSPHNEYLRLLVDGGVVGLALMLVAVVVWYRGLYQVASDHDRIFLVALAPALLILAITEDILFFSGSLLIYAYLGAFLTRSASHAASAQVERGERRPRRSRSDRAPGAPTIAGSTD